MSTPDAEQWERVAVKLDADGWRDAERCVRGETEYLEPHDDWCIDRDGARALIACRDRHVAWLHGGENVLDLDEAAPLDGTLAQYQARAEAWVDEMRERGLVDEYDMMTDFGREVARVLQEQS